MSTGTFDLWQQTFTLSFMANGDNYLSEEGKTPSQLLSDLTTTIKNQLSNTGLQGLIGNGWRIGWGPCMYQTADNAMWVAQNTETNTYVVAVAATNILTNYDWIQEDKNITPEVSWPYGGIVPAGTNISPGTQLGVKNLLELQDTSQTGQPLSLVSYLESVQSSSATLIFTGHSLGGALAPTLATALFAGSQNNLSIDSWKSVLVYPTAGPTPGNQAFNQLFTQLFPPQSPGSSPWQVWNLLVWNSLDMVPHAWNLGTLNQISGLYLPQYSPGTLGSGALNSAIQNAAGTDYAQLPSNGPLPGTLAQLQTSFLSADVGEFLREALYQHVMAYFDLLQVQALLQLTDSSGQPLFKVHNPVFLDAPAGKTA